MGGLCSKKKIADAETENNENEENTDKTPVGERRRKFQNSRKILKKLKIGKMIFSNKGCWSFGKD